MSNRIFVHYDLLMVMVRLMDMQPWLRLNPKTGFLEKYKGDSWSQLTDEVCTVEGNIWISILSLINSEEVRTGGYSFPNHRVNTLLKLRKYLTPSTISQIPHLDSLLRFLEELNVSNSTGGNCLVMQTLKNQAPCLSPFAIVEVGESLYDQLNNISVKLDSLDLKEMIDICTEVGSIMEAMLPSKETDSMYKCKACGEECHSRCSGCKRVLYCSRECQIRDWNIHKADCLYYS
jgi:hypothetical protein